MKRIVRVWHHYEKCEEFSGGMWRTVPPEERDGYVRAAADLMANPSEFKAAMARAVAAWPFSAEHNLTCIPMNRIAWLGHAGCCIGVGAPEDLTRLAWHTLMPSQQDEANRVAAEVLADWERTYRA